MANAAPISNPSIQIKPSIELINYIKNINIKKNLPFRIKNIIYKQQKQYDFNQINVKYFLTNEDRQYLNKLNLDNKISDDNFYNFPNNNNNNNVDNKNDTLLNLEDLQWLYNYIEEERKINGVKNYFHELFKGSEIVLPENVMIPRNEELDKRCQRLKAQQQNIEYHAMTKNVDSVRKKFPEDTLSYQLKQMNRHMIAVFQFIVSVMAGFAFGFIGLEYMVGVLDFGFRLLLGIICSLIIALAELYFLAKKLNEDLQFETELNRKCKKVN